MTPAQVETYVRRIHNSENDDFWSSSEIYDLLTARCNEALSILGLAEAKDTSISTVASTQAYDYPDDFIHIKRVWFGGKPLKRITFRQFESRQPAGTVPEGEPTEYLVWNNQIYLSPTPDSADTLTVFGEKQQPRITAATDTILVPEVFHYGLCDGVIALMYFKDLNSTQGQFFERKWLDVHVTQMRSYMKQRRRSDGQPIVSDSDSGLETENGLI